MHFVPGPREGARAVVVTHLQMLDPAWLIPRPAPPAAALTRVIVDKATVSRSFYSTVGTPWFWVDRLSWTDTQWQEWTDRPQHHLFVLRSGDQASGYIELEQQPDGDVEIAYLGLLPAYAGRGFGGWLLTRALEEAWTLPETTRVWVHTCDLDAPAALANYRSRGMREFARTVEWRVPTVS